ncbi:MAG: zinc ribbon domain-containing protein [Oscillospiraceae bacterium]
MKLLPLKAKCPHCGARLASRDTKLCYKCGHIVVFPKNAKNNRRNF